MAVNRVQEYYDRMSQAAERPATADSHAIDLAKKEIRVRTAEAFDVSVDRWVEQHPPGTVLPMCGGNSLHIVQAHHQELKNGAVTWCTTIQCEQDGVKPETIVTADLIQELRTDSRNT